MEIARTYLIETERCIIRCYEPQDTAQVHEAIHISLEHLRPWLPWIAQEPKSLSQRADLIRRFRGQFDLGMDYVFAIFEKNSNILIGSSGLHTRIGKNAREIGYWIHALYTGKGYATEVVSALIRVGFDIEELSRIEIHCDTQNLASRKIPEKLGFKLESVISNTSTVEKRDLMVWTLTKDAYQKNPVRHTQISAFDFIGQPISL